MDLRHRITEELDNLKFDRLLTVTYMTLKSSSKSGNIDDFNINDLVDHVHKAAKIVGIITWRDVDVVNKVIAAFESSPTFDIYSPDFIKNPPLKKYNIELNFGWSGYGRDFMGGELSGYSKREIEDFLNDGGWSELELIDRDFAGFEPDVFDDLTIEEVTNKINESKKDKSENKDFDRVGYYLEYYKNLTPKDFKVKKKGNEIIITLPESRKS